MSRESRSFTAQALSVFLKALSMLIGIRSVCARSRSSANPFVTSSSSQPLAIESFEMISKSLSRSRMAPLAVLPFEDLEASADHDYLAAGFTEGATTALGHIDPARLSMIGRTSVMTYKDTTKTLAQIGRELGATYLVAGSIRAEGGRWRVTARLIRAADQVGQRPMTANPRARWSVGARPPDRA